MYSEVCLVLASCYFSFQLGFSPYGCIWTHTLDGSSSINLGNFNIWNFTFRRFYVYIQWRYGWS